MKRVLVTGATGFLGRCLVKALRARGDQVCCLVRSTSRRGPLEALGVSFAEGDVTDISSLRAPVATADVVFHVAAFLKAPWMQAFQTINVEGTRHVAQACAEAPSPPILVVVSTLAAAGPCRVDENAIDETRPPQPISIYGRTKLAAEECTRSFAETVPITIVRPPGVFGEGDPSLPQLFGMLKRGIHLLPGRRGQSMSMIHVEDLVAGLLLAADKGERLPAQDTETSCGQGIYFLADPSPVSLEELGQTLASALGRKKLRMLVVPQWLFRLIATCNELLARLQRKPTTLNRDKAAEALAGDWVCDITKAQRQLGFAPALPLSERLTQTALTARSPLL